MKVFRLLFALTSIATIIMAMPTPGPDDEVSPNVKRKFDGIFGKICDNTIQRFGRLGLCLENIPQFHEFTSTFWIQAAEKALCGDDIKTSNTSLPQKVQVKNNFVDTLSMISQPVTDVTSAASAQYLYELSKINGLLPIPLKPWDIKGDLDVINDLADGDDGSLSSVGSKQCYNLCNVLQQSTNELSACWSVISMSVIYAVCEAGCTMGTLV